MHRLSVTVGVVGFIACCSILIRPEVVLAHERRTIAGKYDVDVGWAKEPPLVNQLNAAAIAISKTGTEDGIEGNEKTLKVRIAFGGNEAKEFPLHAVVGRKGYYLADMLPTRSGDYVFTFVGDIEGTPVNERFESGPGRFDSVGTSEDLQFPQAAPDTLNLANEVRVARDEAGKAATLATVGIAVGILGLLVGALSVGMYRRTKPVPVPTS